MTCIYQIIVEYVCECQSHDDFVNFRDHHLKADNHLWWLICIYLYVLYSVIMMKMYKMSGILFTFIVLVTTGDV